MSEVTVRYQATPNPNAGKFTVDRRVVAGDGSRSYYDAEQAAGEPLAEALFGLDGVTSLFMADDFITVTKGPDVDWSALVPAVITAIERSIE